MGRASDTNNRDIAHNKRARRNYAIETTYVAGLMLHGSEIKSVRAGNVNLGDGYVCVVAGELWLENVHIGEYQEANRFNHPPRRRRKLLLHRNEIDRIADRITAKGLTCVPMRIFLERGNAKVELGLGKGKKLHDRREDIKERDAKRDMARAMKQ